MTLPAVPVGSVLAVGEKPFVPIRAAMILKRILAQTSPIPTISQNVSKSDEEILRLCTVNFVECFDRRVPERVGSSMK
jgi:hypothetical protein